MPNQRWFHPSVSKRPFIRNSDVIRSIHSAHKRARVVRCCIFIIINNFTLSNLCDTFKHIRRGPTGGNTRSSFLSTFTVNRIEDPFQSSRIHGYASADFNRSRAAATSGIRIRILIVVVTKKGDDFATTRAVENIRHWVTETDDHCTRDFTSPRASGCDEMI